MKNSLNIQKELEIIKQSFPPVANALEKIIKTFSDEINHIGGDHGSRLTLVQNNSELALSKAKCIENEFKKFKDISEVMERALKLTKHLQSKDTDIKTLQIKHNETSTKLKELESQFTDIFTHSKVEKATLSVLFELITPALNFSRSAAISTLSAFPDPVYEEILKEIKQKRATVPKTSEFFETTLKRITKLVSEKYDLGG